MTPPATRIDLEQIERRESEQIEWKDQVADIDDVVATLTAFANDLRNLGGGYVVCGAHETTDTHGFPLLVRVGLTARRFKEIENGVLARCRSRVSPPLAPMLEELPADEPSRRVLVFVQPSTNIAHTFRRGHDGAKHFVRVGCTTIEARNGLLRELLVRNGTVEPWDRRPCAGATVKDLDLLALRDALQRMELPSATRDVDRYLEAGTQITPFVPSLCIKKPPTRTTRPRNFAILLFGREPQRFVPGAYSVHSEYPGTDRTDPIARRLDIGGTLLLQARSLQERLDLEAVTLFDKRDTQRPNAGKYPQRALHEALINALAHRDYELDDPTRVTSYADRIEFISPGGLPIGVRISDLRKKSVPPRWRNQSLAWFLSRPQLAQAEGQGVQTIRRTMKAAGCPAPSWSATQASVTCVLRGFRRQGEL